FPSLRITKKTNMEPTLVPIQEYKNPFNNPYAAPFANTNTNNGKKGRIASMNGNKIPGTGPKLSYLSNKPMIYSSNRSCSNRFSKSDHMSISNKYMNQLPSSA